MSSIDNSFLPHFITEEVYVFDETNNEAPATENKVIDSSEKHAAPAIELNYEGANNNGVLILVNYANGIPAIEREFLFKILSAVKLTNANVSLIDLGINSTSAHFELIAATNYTVALGFGVVCPPVITNQSEFYKLINDKGRKIVRSHGLSEIAQDTGKKKLLWAALQLAFQS